MLDGLAGCVEVPPPRKSSPSRESPALVCFGGAGSAFGGTALALGGPVLARGGAVSSPNKSIAGAGFACTGGGRFEDEASRWDAERSICTFSCTLLKGTSSSDTSRVDGSGMPPSITQRFDSYFVRMKFSIFASDGIWPCANLASQYLFARALPHFKTLWSCSSVQESRSTDSADMCTHTTVNTGASYTDEDT